MKLSVIAIVVPILIAVLGVYLLVSWWSDDYQVSKITLRTPVAEQTPAAATSKSSPSNAASAPAVTLPPVVSGTATPPVLTLTETIPGDWPRFRGASFDNISTDPTPITRDWSGKPLKELWSLDLGEGYAGPVVHNGRVYVLDYDQRAQSDQLRCLSFANGQQLWQRSYPVVIKRNHGMSRTTPAVTDKYVVTLGPKCQVMCTDAVNGTVYWMHDLVQEYQTKVPEWYAGQCPLIDGDRVIIAPGGKALMVAFALDSGKVIWQTANPKGWQMTHSSIIPMQYQGQTMYLYCADQGVVAVSARDGKMLWETTDWRVSTATVPSPVLIGDGRIFLTGGYNAGSVMLRVEGPVNSQTVRTLYRIPASVFSSEQQTPIFYKGYIYGVISGGTMVCLNLDGKQVWSSDAGHRFGLGPYFITRDDLLVVMNDTGTLTLLQASPAGYKQLAQTKILQGHDSWAPMVLVNGRLLARDLTHMVCLDMKQ